MNIVLRTGLLFLLIACSGAVVAASPPVDVIADCVLCHGTDGRGNEVVRAPRIAGMEAWYLERQLVAFQRGWRGTQVADDPGREMRLVTVMLDAEEFGPIAAWFAAQETPDPQPTLTGAVERGRQHYSLCAQCHGARGEGRQSLGAPALAGQNDWYLARQLHLYRHRLRGQVREDSYGMQMLAMIGTLIDDQAVLDVVAYINTFSERPGIAVAAPHADGPGS
ncbi:MAG: cytochrome c [Gammaproteobacteria bacterium]|nr:cytochrome c [Gammaproteobacteria bacterium]